MGLIKLLNKESINMDATSRTMLDAIIAIGNRRILSGEIKDSSDEKILELYAKNGKLLGNVEITNNELYWMLRCAYSKTDKETKFNIPIVAKPGETVYFTYLKYNRSEGVIEVDSMHTGVVLYLSGECLGPNDSLVAVSIYDLFEHKLYDNAYQELVFTTADEYLDIKSKYNNIPCSEEEVRCWRKTKYFEQLRESRSYKYQADCGFGFNSEDDLSRLDNGYSGQLTTKTYKIEFDTRYDCAEAYTIGDFCIENTSNFLSSIKEVRIDSYSNGAVHLSDKNGRPVVLHGGTIRSYFDIVDKN